MEPRRNRSYSSQPLLAALLIILALSSQFRVAAMHASSENVHCSGSVVGFSGQMAEGGLSMESGTSRRTVRAIKFITPGALRPDAPFCAKVTRGEPYSNNCLPPPSNSYNRGCNNYYSFAITRKTISGIGFLDTKQLLKSNTSTFAIIECSEEYEFLMPSDISKRFLEEKRKYISPGALKPNRPVCNGGASGQSYSSSCLPPPSNPPSRGCSKYYRCRSDN
ncbi:hypothetical protein POTOM_053633 [Populus tomentosa]|uniref:Uncharacterized protein n=1 Tax=Populus tomentosa TaxID=118781 RepID=A0A8X7Y3A9_POPTO|nr:hypothetical protein POTOM_053633 [Populus tomentosa]